MGTESLRTYNKIEPSIYSTKDRIIQIIGFSALLLWLLVYAIETINFNEYENDTLFDNGSLIKAILFLAAFSLTVSILLGTWTYYKITRAYSNDSSNWITKVVMWFAFGLIVLTISVPLLSFPGPDHRFFMTYLIVFLYAGKCVARELLKKVEAEHEGTYM